jgi:hypothetical protein
LDVIISAFQSETRERVIGAILLRKPKSLGRWDSYAAVITTQRMIFAQITSDMVKEAIEKAKQQAKAEGKGFLGQWSAQLGATFNYIQKYLSMEPSAIISETPGNFYIENGAIRDIKIKDKRVRDKGGYDELEAEISSSSGKFVFTLDRNMDNIKMLKQIYGDRVKTPFMLI